VAVYPNRDIPSPEPVPGRRHFEIQTDPYTEHITDKPPVSEKKVATEFYLDRPPMPLFQPKMPLKENCKATQVDDEGLLLIFDFDKEVEPMLNVLCMRTLEQSQMEVLVEEELRIMKQQAKEYDEIRNAELIEA
jgi:radial spoke head protein 3